MQVEDFFDAIQDVSEVADDFFDESFEYEPHRDAARALAQCINEIGYVSLPRMSDQSGLSITELIEALEGIIYQDPNAYDQSQNKEEHWMLRSQYISGNISDKLDLAKKMNQKYNGRFEQNVAALKAAQLEKVPFDEIGIRIGSPWVPVAYYTQFAKELLEVSISPVIQHSNMHDQWKVDASKPVKDCFRNRNVYGYTYTCQGETKCMTMLKILEHTLNGSTIKLYKEVVRPENKSGIARILLTNETLAVQERQELLQQEFLKWIKKDRNRVKKIEQSFYDTLVNHSAAHYDGTFLTLPDLNPEFIPYPHQRHAVARIILEKDVLLNHTVGSGKTNVLIMGVHERYRMGLSRKNLIVVPNNVLEAFERAHRFLYPMDEILVIRPEEFGPKKRNEMLQMIRKGSFVAVYMACSSFELLSMSRQYQLEKKEEEIRRVYAYASRTANQWEKKLAESKAERLKAEKRKLEETLADDAYLTFDQLGITTLVVDEIHQYKNITLKTETSGVAGMHAKGTKRCDELMEKVQLVREQGGSVLFSTGTPITNSLSDLYALQMYLQPEQMQLLGIVEFDTWLAAFCTKKTEFEIDVNASNCCIKTRISNFYNLPELLNIFSSVCDFYTGENSKVGLPVCNGYIDTILAKSPEQKEYIEKLVLRTEAVREKLVPACTDNLLKITHDGRAAALDIRLVDPWKQPEIQDTKAFACAKNVYSCLMKYPNTAQLIFCDLGTPKKEFNLYDTVKYHLIAMGVPREQIAYIHDADTDAKRRKLFEAVNQAKVRVLIGSTEKLGTGVNVQERLIAIHHLDVPWRPSDMIQREGRLIRQGNINKEVFRYRYVTQGTFDAYSWQILQNKQRFVGQFMKGFVTDRISTDVDEITLTYAEIKALSVEEPLIKTRIETNTRLERMKTQKRQREQEMYRLKKLMEEMEYSKKMLQERKARLCLDFEHFTAQKESMSKEDRQAFGEDLLYALSDNVETKKEQLFETLHGFRILLPANMTAENAFVLLKGITENRYEVSMKDAKAAGCIQKIEYVLQQLKVRIHTTQEAIDRKKTELLQAEQEMEKGNPYAEQAAALEKELLQIDKELNYRAEKNAA